MAQADILLTIGIDRKKLDKQLAALQSQLGGNLGKQVAKANNTIAKSNKGLAASLQAPLNMTKQVSAAEQRRISVTRRLRQNLAGLQQEQARSGATTKNLGKQVTKLNQLHDRGAMSSRAHAQGTQRLNSQITALGKSSGGVIATIGGMIKSTFLLAAAWIIMGTIIRGIVGAFTNAVSSMVNLDAAMARVATVTTTTGRSLAETTAIQRKLVLVLAKELPTSLEATTEALFKLSTASLDAFEASAALPSVMRLVVATTKDLKNQTELAGETAKIVAGIYNTYGDQLDNTLTKSEKFERITQVLFKTFSKQQVELQELIQGLTFSVGAFAQAGIPFEELVATLGVLNTQMQKSGRAGRGLQRSFSILLKDTEKLARQFGITFDPEKPLNFIDTIEKIRAQIIAQHGSVESLGGAYKTFGLRGAPNLLALIKGFDDLKEQIALNKSEVDLLGDAINVRTNTIQGKLILLKNAWQAVANAASFAFGPATRILLDILIIDLKLLKGALETIKLSLSLGVPKAWEVFSKAGKQAILIVRRELAKLQGKKGLASDLNNQIKALKESSSGATAGEQLKDFFKDDSPVDIIRKLNEGTVLDAKAAGELVQAELQIASEHRTRIQDLNEEHRIRMLEISGLSKQKVIMEQIAFLMENKFIGIPEKEIQLLKLQNELLEQQLEDWREITDIVTNGLQEGIKGLLKGTTDVSSVLQGIADEFVSFALDKLFKEILFQPVLDTAVNTFGGHVQLFDAAVGRFGASAAGGGGGGLAGAITGGAGSAAAFAAQMAANAPITGGAGSAAKFAAQQAAKAKKPPGLHGAGKVAGSAALGNAFGALGVASAGFGAFQTGSQAGPVAGVLSGVLGGAVAGSVFGPIGAGIGAAIGGIAGLVGGLRTKRTTDTKEQTDTIRIASRIDVTNRELRVLNRNMVGLRKGFEGFVLQQSFFLRNRPSAGVQDQNVLFAVNARRGYQ